MRSALAAVLVAPWVVWALVRAFGLEGGHPGVAVVAFTPWAAATAWIPVAGALVLKRRAAALVALVAALALIAVLTPRVVRTEPAPAPAHALRILTVNLRYGRADPDAVMRLARRHRVDLLSLQELTPAAARRLDAAGADADEGLPERVLEARPGAAGSGLMARLPLEPMRRANPTGAAQPTARVEARSGSFELMAVHPPPPIDERRVGEWRRELRALPEAEPGARILAGDFNATLDHAELRRLLASGYRDAAGATGAGLSATWPGDGRRLPLPIAIDHVLADHSFVLHAAEVLDVLGSDHRAVLAVVSQRSSF